jgi:hypothetical protein
LVLGGVFIILARRMSAERELRLYATGLVIAALIYLVFAARDVTFGWLALELTGVVVFTLVAVLGVKTSAWILALGWAAHAAWDVILHKLLDVAFVPDWYPVVCAGFDLLLAGYIVTLTRRNAFAASSQTT